MGPQSTFVTAAESAISFYFNIAFCAKPGNVGSESAGALLYGYRHYRYMHRGQHVIR